MTSACPSGAIFLGCIICVHPTFIWCRICVLAVPVYFFKSRRQDVRANRTPWRLQWSCNAYPARCSVLPSPPHSCRHTCAARRGEAWRGGTAAATGAGWPTDDQQLLHRIPQVVEDQQLLVQRCAGMEGRMCRTSGGYLNLSPSPDLQFCACVSARCSGVGRTGCSGAAALLLA